MNLILALQIVFIFVIFIINLVFVILPLKIIPRDPSKLSGTKPKRIISFCNCFSGGVFMGVCFLQLTPYVNAKLEKVFRSTGSNLDFCLPTTQCIVIIGFFLTQLTEQIVMIIQGNIPEPPPEKPSPKTETLDIPLASQKWQPLSDMESETMSSDDTDGINTNEKVRMLKPKRKRRPASKKSLNGNTSKVPTIHPLDTKNDFSAVSFRAEDESVHMSHAHSHGGGHGHSHLPVMNSDHFGVGCILLLLAMSLHSFFEGMAVGLQEEVSRLVNLFLGVVVHECLVAFAVGVSLAQQKVKFATIIKLCFFFSSTIPVGIIIGMLIGSVHDTLGGQISSAITQGIAAGTFYHVIFLEILPSEFSVPKDGLWKILFFSLGIAIITALSFSIHGHHH